MSWRENSITYLDPRMCTLHLHIQSAEDWSTEVNSSSGKHRSNLLLSFFKFSAWRKGNPGCPTCSIDNTTSKTCSVCPVFSFKHFFNFRKVRRNPIVIFTTLLLKFLELKFLEIAVGYWKCEERNVVVIVWKVWKARWNVVTCAEPSLPALSRVENCLILFH